MANYIYYENINLPLSNRFAGVDDLTGIDAWNKLTGLFEESFKGVNIIDKFKKLRKDLEKNLEGELKEFKLPPLGSMQREVTPQEEILNTLIFILRNYPSPMVRTCPRLFISHRQIDAPYALRMAQLAQMEGFEFWLDVLDPLLNYVTYNIGPGMIRSLLTACIIEMALINCTHVIACMTPNSRGTLWQPYEYGRITLIPRNSQRAAAWLHPHLATKDFPKYMLLGEITYSEAEIKTWLKNEKAKFSSCSLSSDAKALFLGSYEIPELPKNNEILTQAGSAISLSEWLKKHKSI